MTGHGAASIGGAASRSIAIGGGVSHSVIVGGDDNVVTLTFGGAGIILNLRRNHVRPPSRGRAAQPGGPARELDVLDPERGGLELVGRLDMMAQLRTWAESDDEVSVHAVTGWAGSGKTRLALALCEALDPGGAPGPWRAGFLTGSNLASVVEALATRRYDWAGDARVLVVLDNAAQARQALARWLDGMVPGQFGAVRLRLLLLEREAPENFGWWHELAGDPRRSELFRTLRPIALPGLADLEERRRLMTAACEAAALRCSRPAASARGKVPSAGQDAEVDRVLAGPEFGNPLSLVMAGVLALNQDAAAALALRRVDAAQRLGASEMRRFEAIARASGVDVDALRHVVAFNALAGGLAVSGLLGVLQDELTQAHLNGSDAAELANVLALELPPRAVGGATPGVRRHGVQRPDLVGEAATIAAFTGEPWREAAAADTVRRAYALEPHRAAAALVRLVQDFGYAIEDPAAGAAERDTARRVRGWLEALVAWTTDALTLVPLAQAFPVQSLVLREIAAGVQSRVATALLDRARRSGASADRADAAAALNALANRMGDLGNREAALEAAREAVALRRVLAEAQPDGFTADLSMSLSTLATRLSEVGDRSGALAAAEEAVGLYRGLAGEPPTAFRAELSMALNSLANRLSGLGRRDDALAAVQEAVALRRVLAEERAEAFTPSLAMSLNNLANMLSDVARRGEALAAAEEAVRLFRVLVAARPDAFTPELAVSLNNLANRLSDVGRREEALATAEDAVELCRVLAAARPEAFTPNLAMSLSNLANRLSGLGHPQRALDAAEKAVDLCRVLSKGRPAAFMPDLAMSLNNLANMRADLGDHAAALDAAQEAVDLRRVLAAAQHDAFAPALARSVGNLANRLGKLGRGREALVAAEEAVALYRELADTCPDAFTPDLAMSLDTLANRLGDLGRGPEALCVVEEAVALRRALAAVRPEAFTPDLGTSLGTLARMLGDLGQRGQALDAAAEAAGLYRGLAAVRPEVFTSDLASAVWAWGERLSEDGRVREAIDRLGEGVAILLPSAFAHPADVGARVGEMVRSYLSRCREAGVEPDPVLLGQAWATTSSNGVLQ